jgi:hypothetical protein
LIGCIANEIIHKSFDCQGWGWPKIVARTWRHLGPSKNVEKIEPYLYTSYGRAAMDKEEFQEKMKSLIGEEGLGKPKALKIETPWER